MRWAVKTYLTTVTTECTPVFWKNAKKRSPSRKIVRLVNPSFTSLQVYNQPIGPEFVNPSFTSLQVYNQPIGPESLNPNFTSLQVYNQPIGPESLNPNFTSLHHPTTFVFPMPTEKRRKTHEKRRKTHEKRRKTHGCQNAPHFSHDENDGRQVRPVRYTHSTSVSLLHCMCHVDDYRLRNNLRQEQRCLT